jgi:hypothetical protein
MVEERLHRAVGDIEHSVESVASQVTGWLERVYARAQVSNSLMNLLGIKRREQALHHLKNLSNAAKPRDLDAWGAVHFNVDRIGDLLKALEYLDSLSDILTEAFIDLSAAELKTSKQIERLQSQLGSVDGDLDRDRLINSLQSENETLTREHMAERLKWTQQMDEL